MCTHSTCALEWHGRVGCACCNASALTLHLSLLSARPALRAAAAPRVAVARALTLVHAVVAAAVAVRLVDRAIRAVVLVRRVARRRVSAAMTAATVATAASVIVVAATVARRVDMAVRRRMSRRAMCLKGETTTKLEKPAG